ncbi:MULTISPECIES: hypothetical protein [Bradyrhizobium]|uniref:Uncharacterized protein n=2 Tax=Bradyrhizobium TaxID=374 RepID=A0A939MBE1_9BRAD|nr:MULTISPECIES: hypothetical protein [Bradyrhizobium]UEM17064.1 hypothetical protein J4G43_024245 [Bradyrhizobium barranii subsp. barranii]WLB85886.1 hypothetical protein QIH91_23310 [Bradyrhizobium japonicum USDA 135]
MSETVTMWFIVLMLFVSFVLLANIITMARHIMVMRLMTIALHGFIDQQRVLNDWVLEEERNSLVRTAPE